MPTVRRSVCPYDCPDACGLLVEVENGHAIKASGDPGHPVTRGLICRKMQHYERTVHSPRRLTTPLVRTGPKGSGQFEPISWEEAISAICGRWKELIRNHGADCILPYSYAGTMGLVQRNSGHPFFHKLGASRLARTICSPAKEAGWKALMGDTPGLDPSEMQHSDLIILWGINAAATSIHTMRDAVTAKKRGARLLVIDTYHTPTADHADEAILIRPGSDGALALGMIHVMAAWGMLDREFITQQVNGFDELAETVLPHCPPEAMADICGIPAELIERLALVYARAKAPFIRLGSGLTRYGNGAMNVRCITCLPAVSGAWQKAGGGLLGGTSTGAAFPMERITREDLMPDPPPRIINMNQLGDALTSLAERPVRSLYVYHSNPAAITPDQNAVIRGLERDDLFTVVHERFMTDTARYADIILPATSSLEHSDLYRSYGGYQAQRCAAVIPATGQARSNWDTFCLLAQGMGWDEPFFRQSADDLIEQLITSDSPWRSRDSSNRLAAGEPVLLTPPSTPRGPWLTPSGRIEILNLREPEPLPCLLPTHAEKDGLPLRLQPAVTPFALNSGFYEQEELRAMQEPMVLMMHPGDALERMLSDGCRVTSANALGEVQFTLRITERVPAGTVVTEGVWWHEFINGRRGVNALTSQRLTDRGEGSTLYDAGVEVRAA